MNDQEKNTYSQQNFKNQNLLISALIILTLISLSLAAASFFKVHNLSNQVANHENEFHDDSDSDGLCNVHLNVILDRIIDFDQKRSAGDSVGLYDFNTENSTNPAIGSDTYLNHVLSCTKQCRCGNRMCPWDHDLSIQSTPGSAITIDSSFNTYIQVSNGSNGIHFIECVSPVGTAETMIPFQINDVTYVDILYVHNNHVQIGLHDTNP